MGAAGASRNRALRQRCRALHSTHVLGGKRRAVGAGARPRVDAILSFDLRSADARSERFFGHPISLSKTDDRNHARRCQGGMPLPQQFQSSFRGARAGLRQCDCLRYVGQRRRTGDLECFHGKGWRGVHADSQRNIPGRHYAAESHRVIAPGRRDRGRKDSHLSGFRNSGRDFCDGKLFQGCPGGSNRRPDTAIWSALRKGSRTLLGIRTFMTGEILSEPASDNPGVTPPGDTTIAALTAIWQRVLKRPKIGPDDEFHDLGGNDPLADRIFAEIAQTFHRQLPSATICYAPTIASLTEILEKSELPRFPPFVRLKAGSGKTPILI